MQLELARDAHGRTVAIHIRAWSRLLTLPVRRGAVEAAGTNAAKAARAPKWVIEPVESGLVTQLREVWRYRRMLWFLSVQGVQRRYVGFKLGMLWLFIHPLVPIAIGTLVFGGLLNVPSDGVPYFLFFLTGMTVWMLFEQSTLWATRSLEMNKGLIKKVYFPRVIVPVAAVAPALTRAGVYALLLLGTGVYYFITDGRSYLQFGPRLGVAASAAALSIVFAVALGLWLAVWQVRVRDVRYTLRYVLRFWNYLTPVMYPLSQVPEQYRWLIFLNPMASLVEAFKWGLLGIGEMNVAATLSSVGVVMLTLTGGVWYFNRSEATVVDKL